jgi:hypothetical protein
VGLAIVVFLLGGAVYLFDRPGVLVSGSGLGSAEVSFGPLADSLPSFAHTFAFTVWIALALGGAAHTVVRVAAFWAILESAFELAQVKALSGLLQTVLEIIGAPWLVRVSFAGAFDPWDLAAIWVAGILATCCVLRVVWQASHH